MLEDTDHPLERMHLEAALRDIETLLVALLGATNVAVDRLETVLKRLAAIERNTR